jgi:UDP-2,3-diacylglucosamine pyrophosphatase LpxH
MPHVRAIFLSDIHLGTRACQAERLLDFLRDHTSDYLYLVGDIVDFWAMSRGIYWSPAQNTVIQKLLRRARRGEKIFLIPGNHDEALRDYPGISFGGIRVVREWIHTAADGRRYLLLHGDEFDQVTRYHRWIALLGDAGYDALVRANIVLSWIRRHLGISGYWSLAGYAKRKVKKAVSFICDFEQSVAHAVRARNVHGVICGHIHSATIKNIEDVVYVNCGDWVESCTAVLEFHDGRLEIVHQAAAAPPAVPAVPAVPALLSAFRAPANTSARPEAAQAAEMERSE